MDISPSNSGSNRALFDAALAQLKRSKPKAVVVVQGDGTEQAIALRTGTTRWQQAAKVIARMIADGADRAELRDDSGAVLDTIAAEQRPKAEREASGADPLERLLRLLLKAQEVALDRQSSLFRTAFETTNELIKGMTGRINMLESAQTKVLRAQYEAVTAQARAEMLALEAENESSRVSPLEQLAGAFIEGQAKKNGKAKPDA